MQNSTLCPRQYLHAPLLCRGALCRVSRQLGKKAGRPGSSEVPRNPLAHWDVSSIPANGIFLTKKLKAKLKMPNGWRTIKSLVHKIRLHGRRGKGMAESFSIFLPCSICLSSISLHIYFLFLKIVFIRQICSILYSYPKLAD